MMIGVENVNNSFDSNMFNHLDARNLFMIPEFIIAISGTFNDTKKRGIEGEMELKKIYEEILTLIDSEIRLE